MALCVGGVELEKRSDPEERGADLPRPQVTQQLRVDPHDLADVAEYRRSNVNGNELGFADRNLKQLDGATTVE